ncbi:MAG: hypothetical protein WA728_07755, partial [Xanthobacteraceae bacterium]
SSAPLIMCSPGSGAVAEGAAGWEEAAGAVSVDAADGGAAAEGPPAAVGLDDGAAWFVAAGDIGGAAGAAVGEATGAYGAGGGFACARAAPGSATIRAIAIGARTAANIAARRPLATQSIKFNRPARNSCRIFASPLLPS